jgi:hypothetical protein
MVTIYLSASLLYPLGYSCWLLTNFWSPLRSSQYRRGFSSAHLSIFVLEVFSSSTSLVSTKGPSGVAWWSSILVGHTVISTAFYFLSPLIILFINCLDSRTRGVLFLNLLGIVEGAVWCRMVFHFGGPSIHLDRLLFSLSFNYFVLRTASTFVLEVFSSSTSLVSTKGAVWCSMVLHFGGPTDILTALICFLF